MVDIPLLLLCLLVEVELGECLFAQGEQLECKDAEEGFRTLRV